MSETAVAKRTINHLSRIQQRKVEDWLLKHWKKIQEKRLSKDEVAEIVVKEVGFNVTGQNVKSSAKAMELKWPRPRTQGGGGPQYGRIISSLVDVAEKLCKEWDIEIPEEFTKFKKKEEFKGYKPILVEMALVMRTLTSAVGADFPEDLKQLCEQAVKKSQKVGAGVPANPR